MFELLKSWYGKIIMSSLTVLSGITTVAVNLQHVNLSRTGDELAWWSVVAGGTALLLTAGLFLGLLLLRGRRLLENDWLARLLCYGSAMIVISAALALAGWAIVQAGLLPWATAESAILIHVAVPLLLIRRLGKPAASDTPSPMQSNS